MRAKRRDGGLERDGVGNESSTFPMVFRSWRYREEFLNEVFGELP